MINNNFDKILLVVNSNKKNLELLCRFLKNEEYNLLTAENIHDFEDIITNRKINLALCDVSGFSKEIIKLFGSLEDKDIPFIIIYSPKLDIKSKKELLQKGSSIIEKPLAPEHLKELIKAMI